MRRGALQDFPSIGQFRLRSCALVVLVAVLGCFGQTSSTYPVTGLVKLPDGTPLAGGRILFRPVDDAGHAARGIISEGGVFQLGTFADGDGAVPGAHRVVITPAIPESALDDPASIARYRSTVGLRYQNVTTTPLELNVQADGSANHFEIVLEPARNERR